MRTVTIYPQPPPTHLAAMRAMIEIICAAAASGPNEVAAKEARASMARIAADLMLDGTRASRSLARSVTYIAGLLPNEWVRAVDRLCMRAFERVSTTAARLRAGLWAQAILELGERVRASTRHGGRAVVVHPAPQVRRALELLAAGGRAGTRLLELGITPARVRSLVRDVRRWLQSVFDVAEPVSSIRNLRGSGVYVARLQLRMPDTARPTCACGRAIEQLECQLCARVIANTCVRCHAEYAHGLELPRFRDRYEE